MISVADSADSQKAGTGYLSACVPFKEVCVRVRGSVILSYE